MMDLITSTLFVQVLSILNCTTTFLLWRAHRQLRGLAEISIGSFALAAAFIFLAVRTPHMITIGNTALFFAVAMVTEGITVFVGSPSLRWIILALTAFVVLFWEVIQIVDPANVVIRVVVMTLMLIAIYAWTVWVAVRHDRQFGITRSWLIGAMLVHIAVLLARMALSLLNVDPNFVLSSAIQPWFLLENAVVMTISLFSVMIMVGTRLNEDLNQRTQSLAAERRMHGQLKEFLSMLGHELQTPLTVIERSAELSEMLLDPPQSQVSERLDTIQGTAGRMRKLINNLLTAERAELDGLHGETVDLIKIIKDLERILAQSHLEKRIVAELPSVPAMVKGDGEMLFTAIGNLLENALKFSPKDQPVQVHLHSGDGVKVTISDHGVGFPPHQISLIGRRFFRASNAADIPGTGLGLSIVKTVIEKHHGSVEFANRQGGGAVVTILLPAA